MPCLSHLVGFSFFSKTVFSKLVTLGRVFLYDFLHFFHFDENFIEKNGMYGGSFKSV